MSHGVLLNVCRLLRVNMKVFVYRQEYLSILDKCKIKVLRLAKFHIHVWGDADFGLPAAKRIDFPRSSCCSKIQAEARRALHTFFSTHINGSEENGVWLNYFKKTYDLQMTDFFAFAKMIGLGEIHNKQNIVIAPQIFKSVHSNTSPPANPFIYFLAIALILSLTARFLFDQICCLKTRKALPPAPILYIRKKVYPDMGEFSELSLMLNSGESKKITGVFPFFSLENSKFDFYFLNSIKGAWRAAFAGFFLSIASNIAESSWLTWTGASVFS